MAACVKCKRSISSVDARKAVVDKDEQGRIKAMYHFRCWHIVQKGIGGRAGSRLTDVPTAYEMTQGKGRVNATDLAPEELERRKRAEAQYEALQRRRKEIEAERAREDRPTGFSDWRDPAEADLDELLTLVEEAQEEVSRVPATGEGDTDATGNV